MQFGPNEDYEKYPRAFERDVEMLAAHGVDLLYAPAVERIYPPSFATAVDVGPLATVFEGERRPGHFTGVATIVSKLLHAIEPTSLYLGQKDVQQTAVLRAMVRDLDMATNVVVVPTVREDDGLALSSRNAYLGMEERSAAPRLSSARWTTARPHSSARSRRGAACSKSLSRGSIFRSSIRCRSRRAIRSSVPP
jgi:pantoate--beta-alanine ligase